MATNNNNNTTTVTTTATPATPVTTTYHTPSANYAPTNKHAISLHTIITTNGKTLEQLEQSTLTKGTSTLLKKWLTSNGLEAHANHCIFVSTSIFNGTIQGMPKTLAKNGGWQGASGTFTNANKISFLAKGTKLKLDCNPHPQACTAAGMGYLPIYVGARLELIAFIPLTLDQKATILLALKLNKATLFNNIMLNVAKSLE